MRQVHTIVPIEWILANIYSHASKRRLLRQFALVGIKDLGGFPGDGMTRA